MLIAALLTIAGVLVVGVAASYFYALHVGKRVTGTVTQKIVEGSVSGPNRANTRKYRAVIHYQIGERDYRLETRVATAGILPAYEKGQFVTIVYRPQHPGKGLLFTKVELFKWGVLFVVGLALLGVAGLLFLVQAGVISHQTF